MEPWKCPDCSTWIAPGVLEHRCDDGQHGAGVPRHPLPIVVSPVIIQQPPLRMAQCTACGMWHAGYHACWTVAPQPYIPWTVTTSAPITMGSAGSCASSSTTYVLTG